jgi:hypothetical protein
LEIQRPLKPLNALKPLMNNNLFVAATTTMMMVVWRRTPSLLISGVSVHQRHQRPRESPNSQQFPKNRIGSPIFGTRITRS